LPSGWTGNPGGLAFRVARARHLHSRSEMAKTSLLTPVFAFRLPIAQAPAERFCGRVLPAPLIETGAPTGVPQSCTCREAVFKDVRFGKDIRFGQVLPSIQARINPSENKAPDSRNSRHRQGRVGKKEAGQSRR